MHPASAQPARKPGTRPDAAPAASPSQPEEKSWSAAVAPSAYPSVDKLQKALSNEVFYYAKDRKKAAGRALGTLIELVAFYLLKAWSLSANVAIERPLHEFGNKDIAHNVEYSLHPVQRVLSFTMPLGSAPVTVAKIARELAKQGLTIKEGEGKSQELLSKKGILRNACTVAVATDVFLVATLVGKDSTKITVAVNELKNPPFAMLECKRVGVEEGMKKGPQTIEKAKQGAYVARTVSALQRVRMANGDVGGVMTMEDGTLVYKKYDEFIQEIVASNDVKLLKQFILTVGVVSDHGNWFTHENANKELRVLAQSYDWLVFLTDAGLAQFIHDLLLEPTPRYAAAKAAFQASYTGKPGKNQFTKVKLAYDADQAIQAYFHENLGKVESWFNVISPKGKSIHLLRDELRALAAKDWGAIHK